MDCFYAAIEERDHPELKNKPIAVGGASDRGVICTANYPARVYGVGSAMSGKIAQKLCPKLIFMPIRFDIYRAESAKIFEIFRSYTTHVEGLSLDEAFLDMSEKCSSIYEAKALAIEIKNEIYKKTKLHASVGISYCKYLAKIASDLEKPNGQCLIDKKNFSFMINQLSVRKLPGVGPVFFERLNNYGIKKIKDIKNYTKEKLCSSFGTSGEDLYNYAHGIGSTKITSKSDTKSISLEETYREDIYSLEEVQEEFQKIVPLLYPRLERFKKKKQSKQICSLFVKIKFSDFKIATCSKTLPIKDLENIIEELCFNENQKNLLEQLLKEAYNRYNLPVRLLGLGVKLEDKQSVQLGLF